jgi:hypothetical protein
VYITDQGRAALARVDKMDPKPYYAGGPKPKWARPGVPKKPKPKPTSAEPEAGSNTSVDLSRNVMADLTVYMEVPVSLLCNTAFDAQTVKAAVEERLKSGVGPFMRRWTLDAVCTDTVVVSSSTCITNNT